MRLAAYDKCCGCGNCQIACRQGAIKVEYDSRGFLHPSVSDDLCINCGACEKKCPVINDLTDMVSGFALDGYYGRLKDINVLKNSSSGGIATGLASIFLRQENTAFYGSKYKKNFNGVITERVVEIGDLYAFQGSKYIQSQKELSFCRIKQDLDADIKVLYIGLPCEIAALKLFLHKEYDNLYCVDLVCHGPTSVIIMSEYLRKICLNKFEDITDFNMRFKKDGKWSPYYIHTKLKSNESFEELFWQSDFGAVFARYCNDGCLNCQFKGNYRFSDLTIGDAWGAESSIIEANSSGLSSIIVNSEKGFSLLNDSSIYLVKTTVDEIIKGNPNITKIRKKSVDYDLIDESVKKIGLSKTVRLVRSPKNRIWVRIKNIFGGK